MKVIALALVGLAAAGAALAGGSTATYVRATTYKVSNTTYDAVAAAVGSVTLCDSIGYAWTLGPAGRSGRTINLTGSVSPMCGTSAAGGTLQLASGLPLDVSAQVNPGCFCNPIHQMVVSWDRELRLFVGKAIQVGGCEGEVPITLGACVPE